MTATMMRVVSLTAAADRRQQLFRLRVAERGGRAAGGASRGAALAGERSGGGGALAVLEDGLATGLGRGALGLAVRGGGAGGGAPHRLAW